MTERKPNMQRPLREIAMPLPNRSLEREDSRDFYGHDATLVGSRL